MADKNILNDNRVASTIHFINLYIRSQNHTLLKTLQKNDKVNTDFFVMTGNTVEQLINKYQNRSAKTALVIDDAGLQVINRLHQEGVKDITLCLTRISAEQVTWVKSLLTLTFPLLPVKIIHLNDLKEGMKFDLIIANPPYGAIGANITKKIIDTVDFKEYVNLLPANDYKRNTSKDLYNYQSDMESVNGGFEDATVTTHCALIYKEKANNMTLDEFSTIGFKKSSPIYKLAVQNWSRRHDYKYVTTNCPVYKLQQASNKTSFIFSERDVANRRLPYSKKTVQYRWAVAKDVDAAWILSQYNIRIRSGVEVTKCHFIEFNSEQECSNFIKFIYSKLGFRFIAMLFDCYNSDYIHPEKVFPKVDWTREWTVEEILKDYGYTDEEVQAVMDDLKDDTKYKDMKD